MNRSDTFSPRAFLIVREVSVGCPCILAPAAGGPVRFGSPRKLVLLADAGTTFHRGLLEKTRHGWEIPDEIQAFTKILKAVLVSGRLRDKSSSTSFQHALNSPKKCLSTQLLIVQDDRMRKAEKLSLHDPFTFD